MIESKGALTSKINWLGILILVVTVLQDPVFADLFGSLFPAGMIDRLGYALGILVLYFRSNGEVNLPVDWKQPLKKALLALLFLPFLTAYANAGPVIGGGAGGGAGTGDMAEAIYSTDGKIKTSKGGTGKDSSAWDGCYPSLDAGIWSCDDNDTRMQRLIGLVIGTNVLAPNGDGSGLTGVTKPGDLAAYETATGCTHDGAGNITCASYTTTKVNNTASQQLLYGDNGTQTLGAGWMGPHDTTARTANYYVRMPTEEPTDGQVIAAGTPSEHIAGATWVTPIRAGVTEITKYQYLPAAWFEDNATSPPAAAAVISGEETKARLFADNETSIVLWQVDPEWSAGLKFRVYYSLVANGEANDTAIFRLKGCTIGNSEALTCTAGDPIGVSDEIGTDDEINELMITGWSDAVTITNIAANELARLTFYRGSDDEAGELNVIGIEIKYQAKISAASDY